MEKRIQTTNKSVSIVNEHTIAKELYHLNQIVSFPLSDEMLEDWSMSITELEPKITPEILKLIIDKFKTGVYEYDRFKGIQNIFSAYKEYRNSQPINYEKFYGTERK